ncbi:3-hydroxyisobutyrate dehydrogenase [Pseudoalteromonas sp. SR44-5]|jgi:3-hydroxyisobutyrate dehydrogenase|uniref:3-hydroxyisobutyrate dehydrogenase n=2 Tax=Pseudoalteromonas TaxID=53246 RepID=A0ABY3FJ85_9GAMM|nr:MULTISPECIES: 3-hydroxyisobutyrate dehydrogenase [Pseudoalteromonas]MBB1291861.1 3-hydroxyisobutyrate dehydrogenase [Pseudoalteromonas sp. SR41-4]MBB1332460.1 3-hydroxyisobutyrate dehydrogenase [Pseudoalteromonas sp. SR41-6]MBB1367988.1 3-hydroxyisobutyrate dehydrogenase [Pseudoalteromonas sp. SR44-5]MBB1423442.1 3-hydroxyisobutyrate dehydrogenase [Pseudoalteromonas sp. SG43-7]MBB1433101.1 3-hydroxyisobutyrate dehydrogenase [Pseudoalteromonas sp. SG43-6]
MSLSIGFIGLGNMGGPMAANLVKAGHQVKVFDLNRSVVNLLAENGAIAADDAKHCATDVDVLISMLPASKHVKSLYLGDTGLVHILAKSTLVIDCSTIDAASARDVGAELSEHGIDFVDAPVSGGVAGATAGTLTFIVGGGDEQFAKAQPVLADMGKNIFHAGDIGAGQVAKICNNMLLSILMAGTSEAIQMGINNGLDAKVLSDIMTASSGRNWTLELYNPCPGVMATAPASNDYKPGFMVDLMAKDLGLAMEAAQQSNSVTPMGSMAKNLYTMLQHQGAGSEDFSAIFKLFSKE